jgi:RNA polymerase sigma factor (TIGR02999 family)
MTAPSEISALLTAYASGDRGAFERVVPLVYEELRRLARRHLRRTPAGTSLDTTGLVHEAYLKLAASEGLRLQDRDHLLAVSAVAMRQVIVSRARARTAGKRGGGKLALPLDEAELPALAQAEWLLDLDRALEELRRCDPRLAAVVDCRFFAGLSEEETAQALGQSLRSVQRGWVRARAWLRSELQAPSGA